MEDTEGMAVGAVYCEPVSGNSRKQGFFQRLATAARGGTVRPALETCFLQPLNEIEQGTWKPGTGNLSFPGAFNAAV